MTYIRHFMTHMSYEESKKYLQLDKQIILIDDKEKSICMTSINLPLGSPIFCCTTLCLYFIHSSLDHLIVRNRASWVSNESYLLRVVYENLRFQ